jgi:dCMP deaminase
MGIADAVSLRAHDEQTKVGAVLVKNDTGMVVATAHNGFVRGAPDDLLPKTRPEKYEYMMHAEDNLISHCAKSGISVDNCSLVITMSPCQKCLRLLWQSGITQVICKNLYRDHCIDMKDLKIEQEQTEEGFFKLIYKL